MLRTILLGIGLLFVFACGAQGEPPDAVKLGSRVRATYVDRSLDRPLTKSKTGELIAVSAESITLRASESSAPAILPRQDVTQLELSLARSRKGTGALLGLGVGAVTGALIGFSSGDDPPGFISFTAEGKAALMAFMLAPIGALIGLIGAQGEQWAPISVEQVQLKAGVGTGGTSGVLVTVRF